MSDEPTTIDNWIVDDRLHIRGDIRHRESGIRTSRVTKREGNLVTTRTGSVYELGNCHPYLETAESIGWLNKNTNANNGLEFIDWLLEQQDER